ncbi:MAG: myxosortase-dependent metalloprotease, MXAN_2677/MXAN_2678 family [Myxococcaceae bacterium]
MSVAAAFLALALSIPDEAYVRSRSDTGIPNDPNAHCLWWPVGTIRYQQASKGNPETRPAGSEFTAVRRSFDTWQRVMDECGNLALTEGPRLASASIGYDAASGDNTNTIVFRQTLCANQVASNNSCWLDQTCMNVFDCWQWQRNTIALTTTTYERSSGRVYDADVEFNAFSFIFTTVDSPSCPAGGPFSQGCVATDIQNTMTHEAGHVIGLDHTARAGSTMNPSAPTGETAKRVVDPGSKSFVCDVYPKGLESRDCVINPMSSTLGQADGCGAAGGPPALLALAALLSLAGRSRVSPR